MMATSQSSVVTLFAVLIPVILPRSGLVLKFGASLDADGAGRSDRDPRPTGQLRGDGDVIAVARHRVGQILTREHHFVAAPLQSDIGLEQSKGGHETRLGLVDVPAPAVTHIRVN